MSHTAVIAQGQKTRGIVAFLPIVFGLAVRRGECPASPTHRSTLLASTPVGAEDVWRNAKRRGSLTQEKEPGNENLLDPDSRSSEA